MNARRSEGKSAPSLRQDHPCWTGFLDETGSISLNEIFGVGLLTSAEPSRFLRKMAKTKDRKSFHKELKFVDVTAGALDLYKQIVDDIISEATEFFAFVADRGVADPVERFGNHWEAYSKLAEQLVIASLHPGELMSLMADNYSTPDSVLFEEDLKARVNRRRGSLALVSAVRLDSKSSLGLQAVDILTSAVAFEFRCAAGEQLLGNTPKAKLAAHVRESLGAKSLITGWRNRRHSVQIYNHGAWTPT